MNSQIALALIASLTSLAVAVGGIRHTLFVFAEFLCWIEVLRQGVSFLDLGDNARNRKLMKHITVIRRVMFDNQMDRFSGLLQLPAGTG